MGDFGDRSSRRQEGGGSSESVVQRSPGKRSLVEGRYGVQRRRDAQAASPDEQVHAAAEAGLAPDTVLMSCDGPIESAEARVSQVG